jgi:ethanolaminephosphotransferase
MKNNSIKSVFIFFFRLKKTLSQVVHILCLSRALPLAVYTVLVTCMRYHLFVWTVFSPKLLYEGMLTVVLSAICFIILLGSMFC